MNRYTDIGNRVWYVIISLIASIISIVVFVTGRNIPDYKSTPIPSPTTFVFLLPSSTPALALTPTSVFTPTGNIMVTPTSLGSEEKWKGILRVRMPTLNEIRAEKPVSLWSANSIDVQDMHEPGIVEYRGKVAQGIEYLLPVYWCALSSELLSENMEFITTEFLVNGEKIPEKYIFTYRYDTNTHWFCSYHAVVLGGWAKGAEYILDIRRTLVKDLTDGQTDYAAGKYIYRIVVKAH